MVEQPVVCKPGSFLFHPFFGGIFPCITTLMRGSMSPPDWRLSRHAPRRIETPLHFPVCPIAAIGRAQKLVENVIRIGPRGVGRRRARARGRNRADPPREIPAIGLAEQRDPALRMAERVEPRAEES
jgi:hypothetical protein